MSFNAIREALRRRPFTPFRIQVSDGKTYDVRHPDMMVATVTAVAIASSLAGDEERPDLLEFIAMEHIVRLTILPATAKESA